MTTLRAVLAAACLAAAAPAAAQLSNRSIALESGLSAPLGARGAARAAFALAATGWLEGPVEAVARVRYGSAERTGGRGADALLAATLGARASLLPDPLRPQLGVEAGWARRIEAGGATASAFAAAAFLGLEWFPARDLSVAVRAGCRWVGGAAAAAEAAGGFAAYF